ncbi:MAG: hypothetical protein UR60_C0015G0022 [Candidatus Moranbacteria bacterium GW2011_GWF2_34_56]|nr:MAG: hypothetical protein UR51_C0003G0008 [Candidatus Moranbacteria bacterium GW2011_GWF1_34_10]KKP64797.1 MAG: hypothetical protein UR60_C0015G0022 [Candidatus Moranbacteria bacterium GW2011_GWF2_34_56]HBI16862.1 hypothetical protein [Candidatus Moranbacteria bacterium]
MNDYGIVVGSIGNHLITSSEVWDVLVGGFALLGVVLFVVGIFKPSIPKRKTNMVLGGLMAVIGFFNIIFHHIF